MVTLLKLVWIIVRVVVGLVWEIVRFVLPFNLGKMLPSILFPKKESAAPQQEDALDYIEPLPYSDPLKERVVALRHRCADDDRYVALAPVLEDDLPALVAVLDEPGEITDAAYRERVTVAHAELGALLEYLEEMVEQRASSALGYLGDADAVAESLFAPLRAYADRYELPLPSRAPVSVYGDWGISVDISFRNASIAPLRIPETFAHNIFAWTALAHEVAHDFYFSLRGFEESLHERLRIPSALRLPNAAREYGALDPRFLLGAWLAEIFADMLGTLQMGPAYSEAMLNNFANPQNPEQTRTAYAMGRLLAYHPPSRLRMIVSLAALDFLGFHKEAQDIRQRWEALHSLEHDVYLLPGADDYLAMLPAEIIEKPAAELVDTLLRDSWPSLKGGTLLSIHGCNYLGSDHAQVRLMVDRLTEGARVKGAARLVIAAGVLAAAGGADPRQVMEAVRASIIGRGTSERRFADAPVRRPRSTPSVEGLPGILGSSAAFREAIIVGEAIRPRQSRM